MHRFIWRQVNDFTCTFKIFVPNELEEKEGCGLQVYFYAEKSLEERRSEFSDAYAFRLIGVLSGINK